MDTKSYMRAINYARSTFSKDEPFHISRLAGDVLVQIIELCNNDNETTVSNKRLGDILYVPVMTIKDIIGMLLKAGFIETEQRRTFVGDLKVKTRVIRLIRKRLTQITQVLPVDTYITSIFDAALERMKVNLSKELQGLG